MAVHSVARMAGLPVGQMVCSMAAQTAETSDAQLVESKAGLMVRWLAVQKVVWKAGHLGHSWADS